VVLPDRHSAGLSETVARASAGALEHVRVARVGNLVQALEILKARGLWIVGFDAAGPERWDTVDLTHPVAFVLGGEGRGMRRLVREHCDHLVSIPHFGHVSSLNVSVAAGIALYEVVRQRGAVPSQVRPIPARPPAPPQIVGPGPDDVESDPGALAHGPGERPDADETDHDDDSVPRVDLQVDMLDDVAWGSGPIVLKPVGFGTSRRSGGGRRRRKGGGLHRPPSVPPPAAAPQGALPRAEVPAGTEIRGRRRRRRGRRGGEPHRPGPGAISAAQAPPREAGDGGGPPSDATGSDPSPSRGRRRRRRRRRHGP
jgi:tRNA(Leu) C34 or U34 (ribose-2'-O)-methylase TrmL